MNKRNPAPDFSGKIRFKQLQLLAQYAILAKEVI